MHGHHLPIDRCSLEPLEFRRLLSAGDPDTTFGVGGRIEYDDPDDLTQIVETVALPDGKLLFAGYSIRLLLAGQDQYILRRLNADGSPDTTFGGGDGVVVGNFTNASGDDSHLVNIAVAPNGKIYAVGEGGGGFVLARFNADGSPDATFGGGDGSVGIADLPLALEVQPAGSVTRYLADGALDTSFGVNGTAPSPFDNPVQTSTTAVVRFQSDGKLLLGGRSRDDDEPFQFAVGRLNADGSTDTGFGDNGRTLTPLPVNPEPFSSVVSDLVLLPGGKFLAGGSTVGADTQSGAFVLARYNADGTLDSTFGTSGISMIAWGHRVGLTRIVIDGDDNAVLVGHGPLGLTIARVTPDGDLDDTLGRVITFGSGSPEIVSSFGGSADPSTGATIQPDGKLVVAGQRRLEMPDGTERNTSSLVRFHMEDDGAPSPVALDAGQHVLSVAGTGGRDLLEASEVHDVVYAHRNGFGRAFEVADVQRVDITGGDGNDQIVAGLLTVGASVVGGLGTDKISGGAAGDTLEGSGGRDFIDGGDGDDLINGGGGNDALRGQGGDDTLHGAAGDDELRGNAGLDTYDGGPGDDLEIDVDDPHVSFQDGLLRFFDPLNDDDVVSIFPDGAGGLVIYVDGQTDTIPMNLVGFIELNGNGGDDYLKVHPFLNIRARIFGGIGPMTDRAGGNDTLIGGARDDTLVGHGGNDFLFGNGGNDHLDGGEGADVFRGHGGRDTADYLFRDSDLVITLNDAADDGHAGENDLVFTDVERVLGGSGNDRITAGAGNHILFGGDGDDTLDGGAGHDALYGAGGDDHLEAGAGDDYLEGGAGHDLLAAGPGADQLFGLAGNDRLFADDGAADTVRGGPGTDSADADDLDDVLAVESVT